MHILLVLTLSFILCCMPRDISAESSPHEQSSLGHDFGQLMTIEGTILDEDARQMKEDLGKIVMKIETVNEKPLKESVVLPLSFFAFTSLKAPQSGKRIRYIGYETGSFEGIPSEAFKWIPMVATKSFHFANKFQVCAEVK